MSSVEETVDAVVAAKTWDQRVAALRQVPQRHGTRDHPAIFAAVASSVYVPHLAPDFAYIHRADFYEKEYFEEVYAAAASDTDMFRRTAPEELADVVQTDPRTLLVFRTVLGLTREEFAHSTQLAGKPLGLAGLSPSKVDAMERRGTPASPDQARVAAATISAILDGSLFGGSTEDLKIKQDKPDTEDGWRTVRRLAAEGVPYDVLLHQRHYGGAFRQVLDATSTQRGNLIEDAVQDLFEAHAVPFIRTGSHNQREIEERFEVVVTPAPDFVVHDGADNLRAMLECKGTNNGGTARDKALRFERLRDEANRLGGVPLLAVLGGMGWARVNDTLGPVVRDTDGRVFTLSTLEEMLSVSPFPTLVGQAATSASLAGNT